MKTPIPKFPKSRISQKTKGKSRTLLSQSKGSPREFLMGQNGEPRLSWAEIDLKAIQYNYQQLRNGMAMKTHSVRVPSLGILAVLKGDAYGHGMLPVAHLLDQMGVEYFGVSDVAEGKTLRESGIRKPILLFESTLPSLAGQIVRYDLTPTICNRELAAALNRCAPAAHKRRMVHIKIDTGMGRLGLGYHEAADFIKDISQMKNLVIEGIYTHFPLADTDPAYTHQQISQLDQLIRSLDRQVPVIRYIHAANSMGLLSCDMNLFNLARPGLMLYGLYPHPKLQSKIDLKPAMSVKAKVIFIKDIPKGRGISYGHTFIARRDMRVATLAIGYNDGYGRYCSNKGHVLVGGQFCPVVGNVTMDQTMVDVSQVPQVRLGMEAVILGRQGDLNPNSELINHPLFKSAKRAVFHPGGEALPVEPQSCIQSKIGVENAFLPHSGGLQITADDIAQWAQTINYEIICALGNRLPRIYKTLSASR